MVCKQMCSSARAATGLEAGNDGFPLISPEEGMGQHEEVASRKKGRPTPGLTAAQPKGEAHGERISFTRNTNSPLMSLAEQLGYSALTPS